MDGGERYSNDYHMRPDSPQSDCRSSASVDDGKHYFNDYYRRPDLPESVYRDLVLFDPDNQKRPQLDLMTDFIPTFFETYGKKVTFLSYTKVLADILDDRLNDLLANCIAAMAVKSVFPFYFCVFNRKCSHSQLFELQLSTLELHIIVKSYLIVAKVN